MDGPFKIVPEWYVDRARDIRTRYRQSFTDVQLRITALTAEYDGGTHAIEQLLKSGGFYAKFTTNQSVKRHAFDVNSESTPKGKAMKPKYVSKRLKWWGYSKAVLLKV
ncbi:hypothetical protein Tsp_09865 [Trichinella spiralis]|uniref:hypothetical protein n=1 Tax=Trichinella spiralis TaxID=6334 RepID=UPI0001EFDC0C|nr:hypothetical protein Tsp_09865 [Trichinella spiralis]